MRDAFDCLVEQAIEANRRYISDLEMQAELYKRYIAYGYVYKVSEDLVRKGLPADWKPDDAGVAGPERDGCGAQVEPLWVYFCGKPNSQPVLYEKAKVLTSLIEMVWSTALILAAPLRDHEKGSCIRLEQEQARSIISETAALLIRVVDEVAFSALGPESSDEFMEAPVEFVGLDLQGRGVQRATFAQLLEERLTEYAGYRKWVPGRGENTKGTLFWEFGKKVADIVGVGNDPVFNVLLTNVLMRSLAEWRTAELLRGVAS
jgi:hypothetical protein